MNTYVTPLRCCRALPGLHPQQIGIYLCRTLVDDQYRRLPVDGIDLFSVKDQRPEHSWPHDENTVKTACVYVADTSMVALAPLGGLPIISFSQVQPLHTYAPSPKLRRRIGKWRRTTTRLNREQPPRRHFASSLINQQESVSSIPLDMERQSSRDTMDTAITLEDWERGVTIEEPSFVLRAGFNSDFDPVCLVSYRCMFSFCNERITSCPFNQNATYSRWVGKIVLPIPGLRRTCVIKGHRLNGLEAIVVCRLLGERPYTLAITLRRDPQTANGLTWRLTADELSDTPTAVMDTLEVVCFPMIHFIGSFPAVAMVLFFLKSSMTSTVQGVWDLDHRDATEFVASILIASVFVPFVVWGFVCLMLYTLNKHVTARGKKEQLLCLPLGTEAAAERIFARSRKTEVA